MTHTPTPTQPNILSFVMTCFEWLYMSCCLSSYTLSNSKIRCDVICGRLRASLRITLKYVCFAVIPYTALAFYGNSPQIRNDTTSNLKFGQGVAAE